MTLAAEMQIHARTVRARLWRPPNTVPDHGIDLGGKALKAALTERKQRNAIEHFQLIEQARLDRVNCKAEKRYGLLQRK